MIRRFFNALVDFFVEWGEFRARQHLRRGHWY